MQNRGRKLDIADVISATMAAQDAKLDSIAGESILALGLLLLQKCDDMQSTGVDIELDLSELVTLGSYTMLFDTNPETATTRIVLQAKPSELGVLGRGN